MKTLRLAAVLLLAAVAAQAQARNQASFQKVFNGITAPAVSTPVRNIGQSLHLITATFPTATADVESLQIRIEASYDGTNWFPISEDITTARYVAGSSWSYALARAGGNFPLVRVAALAVSATYPLTLWYTGGMEPIGNIIFAGDRFVPTPPAADSDKVTWGICVGSNCAVAQTLTVSWIATRTLNWSKCYIAARTAPAGASLIVDINKNGTTIFGSGSKLVLPSGSTLATQTTFAVPSMVEGDLITIDVDQIGSSTPGKDVTVTCTLR